jgi:hypothetical protein
MCCTRRQLTWDLRVVTDERSDLAVGGAERDGRVDTGRKRGDTVLEEVTDDLHDGRLVLDDGDVWRAVKLTADTFLSASLLRQMVLGGRSVTHDAACPSR